MRALASYIMRGQLQAVTAVTLCAILALVLIPLSWPIGYLSAAGVALVTLVHGTAEGGKTVLAAALIQAVIGMLALGHPALALAFALSLWLPAWLLATVLRLSRSLALSLQVLLLLGLLAVLLIYLLLGEPAQWWQRHITEEVLPALQKAEVELQVGPEFGQHLNEAAQLMSGVLVMLTAWGMVAGLLVARWWQSVLYRPGAFAEEFRGLRFGRLTAILAMLMMAVALSTSGLMAELAANLLMVVTGMLALQGLAIAHALVAALKANHAWLVLLYMMLVFLMPYVFLMVAMVGLIDNWADFRKRFQALA